MSEQANNAIDVVIVDDNPDDVILIREALAETRMMNVVQVLHNGDDALAYLQRAEPYPDAVRPQMVLLDINMPGKNGFEVLQAVKADPALRVIPIVMLTTSNREEDIVRGFDGGACSYLTKPIDFDDLLVMTQQLAHYWMRVSKMPPTQ